MSAFLLALCGLLHCLSIRPVLVSFCKGILFGASAWLTLSPEWLCLGFLFCICCYDNFFGYLKSGYSSGLIGFARELRLRLSLLLREGDLSA